MSSRGYGFLLNQPEYSRWRMANDRRTAWQVQASASRLDYTVVFGPTRQRAVSGLTAITGRHRVPPGWAQGPMVSRAIQTPALPTLPAPETAATYRAKIERDLADIERYDVKLSAYAFEGYALLRDFDYVKSVIRRLDERGIKTVLYHRAYVSNDSLNTQPAGDYEETARLGLVAKTRDGRPYVFGSNGGAPATLLDFTNPRTLAWWRNRLKMLHDAGVDGFMQDFGEQVQDDMHFADGSTGKTMHNRYPVLFHRASRRIIDDIARAKGRRDPYWFFTRAGYSGRPGSAAYEMGTFPGDETVDWSAGSGLRSQGPDMLNRAVGRSVRLHHRHRRLHRLAHRAAHRGAVQPLERVGGPHPVLPRAQLGGERHADAVGLRPGHPRPLDPDGIAAPAGRALHQAPVAQGAPHRGADHPADVAGGARGARRGHRVAAVAAGRRRAGGADRPGGRDIAQRQLPARMLAPPGRAGQPATAGRGRATVQAPLGVLPYFFRCGTRPF